ncbi:MULTISPECIES: hypothetical protein [unclassified Actinotalea]|uniref:hypothetical protein n=1 Tax=unclassified Actinotalea TaxID=2638618 RepID=UPI0015F3BE8E|nr:MULTISPECIES: hypothetical protein [unclassified Actinotalea]
MSAVTRDVVRALASGLVIGLIIVGVSHLQHRVTPQVVWCAAAVAVAAAVVNFVRARRKATSELEGSDRGHRPGENAPGR